MNWNWREWSLDSSAVHYSVACGLLAIWKVIPNDTDDSRAIFLRINIFTLLLDSWRTVTRQLSAVFEWIIVAMIDSNGRNAALPNAHGNLAEQILCNYPRYGGFRKCSTISRIHDSKLTKIMHFIELAMRFISRHDSSLLWQLLPQTESLEIKTNQTKRKTSKMQIDQQLFKWLQFNSRGAVDKWRRRKSKVNKWLRQRKIFSRNLWRNA